MNFKMMPDSIYCAYIDCYLDPHLCFIVFHITLHVGKRCKLGFHQPLFLPVLLCSFCT